MQTCNVVNVVWCKRCPWIAISVHQNTVALGFRDIRLVFALLVGISKFCLKFSRFIC